MIALLVALLACGGEEPVADPVAAPAVVAPAVPPDGAVWQGTTQTGLYALSVRFDPPRPALGALFAVEATLTDREGAPVEEALVALDARMPQHGHGMMTDPQDLPGDCAGEPPVCSHPGGVYRTEGFKLHMGGAWTVTIEVQGPRGRDTTSFPYTP
ncbi:MAG: FixH family protein [Alphaproteobacteria bacterium]|nr:FixH family protein [Alphaproteobacteria bacterium]